MAKKVRNTGGIPAGKKGKMPTHIGKWGIGEIIIGGLATLMLLVGLLARPTYIILNHTVVFNDGIIAPAIIFGAVVWTVIEVLTPPGKGIVDLIVRAFFGFLVGGFIGGVLGYEFGFAQYILIPAYNGQSLAVLYLLSILVFGLVVIWDAAWSDKKGYLGQKGGKARTLNFRESGSSKGARKMIGLIIALVSVFLMIFLSAGIGHALVSGSDSSPVLQSESVVSYVYGLNGAVPFGQVNGTATFDFPVVNNTTNEAWVQTNLTVAEMNSFTVSKIVLATNDLSAANVTLGIGTNRTNFIPFLYENDSNLTTASFAVSPEYLTGNQSQDLMFLIQSNVTAISMSFTAYGNTGLTTMLGSYSAEQTGYILGTIFTFVSAILVAPWHDFSVTERKPRIMHTGKSAPAAKKKGGK